MASPLFIVPSAVPGRNFEIMSRRNSFFGSLASKMKRRNSRDGSSPTSPFQAAPATRRPHTNPFASPDDAPPAYSAAAPARFAEAGPNPLPTVIEPRRSSEDEDGRYAFLRTFDTVFVIDDSGSMAGRSWRETAAALAAVAPICTRHDADGVDVRFLNAPDEPRFHGVRDAAAVEAIFASVRPRGATPTGQTLHSILRPYMARYARAPEATKPLNLIVITDGEPSDDVESPIIAAAKKLDKLDAPAWQVGIQFFQVGNEPGAREHLKQLDDDLAELAGDDDLRDMVDTVPWTSANGGRLTSDGILKVVLGAVTRRLDNRRSCSLHSH
jgi:Mg-chelatase subunit ChlD